MDGVPGWKLTGHDGDAAWGADRAVYGEVAKINSFFCHLVQVRCLAEGAAVLAHVGISPVICEDEYDVRSVRCVGGDDGE